MAIYFLYLFKLKHIYYLTKTDILILLELVLILPLSTFLFCKKKLWRSADVCIIKKNIEKEKYRISNFDIHYYNLFVIIFPRQF